jgi:hypothetical protein
MSLWNNAPRRISLAITQSPTARVSLVIVLSIAAAPLLMLKLQVPASIVLPTLSMLWIAGAAVVALFAWSTLSKRDCAHVSLWDVSGACALIGFAAAIFSDPDHVIEFLGLSGAAP